MSVLAVGTWVHVADASALSAFLDLPNGGTHPRPEQILHAGRLTRVVRTELPEDERGS